MAVAQRHVERRVIEDVTVILKLSEDEARTLAAVLALVNGDRRKSPREHAVSILNALREARVLRGLGSPFEMALTDAVADHPATLASGAINFRTYPED
jgi:hypothetical protein